MMYLSFIPFRRWWGWRKKCLCELHGDKCFLFALPGKMVAVFFTNKICNCVSIPSSLFIFSSGFDFLRCLKHSEGGGNAINFYKQTLSLFPRQIQCTFCWVIGIQEVTWSVLTKCEWAVFIMKSNRDFGNPNYLCERKWLKRHSERSECTDSVVEFGIKHRKHRWMWANISRRWVPQPFYF